MQCKGLSFSFSYLLLLCCEPSWGLLCPCLSGIVAPRTEPQRNLLFGPTGPGPECACSLAKSLRTRPRSSADRQRRACDRRCAGRSDRRVPCVAFALPDKYGVEPLPGFRRDFFPFPNPLQGGFKIGEGLYLQSAHSDNERKVPNAAKDIIAVNHRQSLLVRKPGITESIHEPS